MAAVLFTGTTVFAAPLQTQTVSCKNTVIFSNSDWKSICSADDLKALLERLCNGQLPETPDCPETPDAPITPDVPTTPDVPDSSEDEADVHPYVLKVVELVNKERKSAGLNPVTLNTDATTAAQVRAEESSVSFSHTRPDGRNFNTVTDCPYMAENIHRIATRYLSQHDVSLVEAAVDGWANSETHLRNIRNERLNAIGVGIAKGINAAGEESWYCVQLFLYDGCVISQVDIPIMNK